MARHQQARVTQGKQRVLLPIDRRKTDASKINMLARGFGKSEIMVTKHVSLGNATASSSRVLGCPAKLRTGWSGSDRAAGVIKFKQCSYDRHSWRPGDKTVATLRKLPSDYREFVTRFVTIATCQAGLG